MKTRFNTIDIRALVKNLNSTVISMRVANIYDINPRTYLLKLAKPEHKAFLLIESGTRLHTTDYTHDKSDIPSVFSLKLRKYLRTKRLENVQQMGVDRLVVLTFGSGPATQHLIIEMYSQGNIILTDGEYTILALLRTHKFDEDNVVAVNNKYPIHLAKQASSMTVERLSQLISSGQKGDSVKQLLLKSLDFGPELVEHCLKSANLNPDTKVAVWDPTNTPALLSAVQAGEELFERFQRESPKGFVVLKEGQPETAPVYEEAAPILYAQYAGRKVKEFPSFNEAVDAYFSQAEAQKADVQRSTAENAAKKKLDKFREEHAKRISSMHEAELTNERRARLIEANLTEVEQCLAVVRSALATGMDWAELGSLVKEEKKRNPGSVANIIHRLVLDKNMITLLLSDPQDDYDESDESDGSEHSDEDERSPQHVSNAARPPELVDIDIALSGYANARKYFELKKQTTQKAQKTIDITEQALKAAERKSQKALKEAKTKQTILLARKPFWFEKFYWFISSENFVIVCGRDAQQNEMLYKRYLEKDDIYVHADIHGASTCVIKNPSGKPIPPQTLAQAGVMCVCLSAAWQAKIVTSAWWVYAHQVSKTAPTGEYLTTGSFMIRGKKNFLPPAQLVLGFGFMFRLDESSIPNHAGERSKLTPLDATSQPSEDRESTPTDHSDTKPERSRATKEDSPDAPEQRQQLEADTTSFKYKVADPEAEYEDGNEAKEEADTDSTTSASDNRQDIAKKKLTAHERRQMKRGKDPSTPAQHPEPKPKPAATEENAQPVTPATSSKKKKGKLAELDEDERAARAQLLGLGGKPKPKGKKGKEKDKGGGGGGGATKGTGGAGNAKGGSNSKAPNNAKGSNNNNNKGANNQKGPKLENKSATTTGDASTAPAPAESEAKTPNETAPSGKQPSAADDDDEVRQLEEEEDNAEEAQKANERMTNLDSLTGQPRSDDVLLHAIPVVGPYSAMTSYKYKIKITPGHTKRGKAAKAAQEALFRNGEATTREKDLIRAISLEELARSMIANVKLHATLAARKAAREKHGKDLDFDIIHEDSGGGAR